MFVAKGTRVKNNGNPKAWTFPLFPKDLVS